MKIIHGNSWAVAKINIWFDRFNVFSSLSLSLCLDNNNILIFQFFPPKRRQLKLSSHLWTDQPYLSTTWLTAQANSTVLPHTYSKYPHLITASNISVSLWYCLTNIVRFQWWIFLYFVIQSLSFASEFTASCLRQHKVCKEHESRFWISYN